MIAPYYSDGTGIVIYNWDSTELLPHLVPVDHVICDPPYDTETHQGARTAQRDAAGQVDPASHRIAIDFDPLEVGTVVPMLLAKAARWTLAFCGLEMLGEYRRHAGEAWIRAGFWHRVGGAPQFTGDRPAQPGEGIAIMHRALNAGRQGRTAWNGGGRPAFWSHPIVKHSRVHPTQKPQQLIEDLIADFTDPGDTILDPYAGSCTTAVAARRLGRKCICVEIEERWCEEGARRLSQALLPLV